MERVVPPASLREAAAGRADPHFQAMPKGMQGRTALPKQFPHAAGRQCENHRKRPVLFRPASAGLLECVRVLASLYPSPTLTTIFSQKSSGTLIRSVLNEYTDFTNPDRALLSNQEAEHHEY